MDFVFELPIARLHDHRSSLLCHTKKVIKNNNKTKQEVMYIITFKFNCRKPHNFEY